MNIGNNPRLKQYQVRIGKNYFIQFPDINNCMVFLLFIAVKLLKNQNKKTNGSEISNKFESALVMHFVKSFVNNMVKLISKRVNP